MLASLEFIVDNELYAREKPYEIRGLANILLEKRTNIEYCTHDNIEITDSRGREHGFTIEEQGFSWIPHSLLHSPSSEVFEGANQDKSLLHQFLNETVSLVKRSMNAGTVICYDWRFRRNGVEYMTAQSSTEAGRNSALPAVSKVHGDYSYLGGHERLKMHLNPDEYESLTSRDARIRMVNAWRPLDVVQNAPLAFCDRQTVGSEEILEVDKILPDQIETETCMQYRKHHKRYWLSQQLPTEVALFVTWENSDVLRDRAGTHHSSCSGPDTVLGETPRESVEVRLIVIS